MTDQPPTDHEFIQGYLKVTLLGIIWVCVGMVVGHMQRGGLDRSRARGVARDPAGHVPFRDYAREVHARLNVTSGAMASPQQAAATQRGLVGLSRAIATRAPARVVNCSVVIQVHQADAVTYLLCPLSAKFENSDDERQRALGAALVDFRVERGERVDSVLTKLEMARLEADAAGFAIPNCQMLTLILFRAPGVGAAQASRPLQPSSRQMPGNQRQREQLLERARSYGHLAERAPGNAGGIFSGGRGHRAGIFIGATADAGSPAAGGIWADGGPGKNFSLARTGLGLVRLGQPCRAVGLRAANCRNLAGKSPTTTRTGIALRLGQWRRYRVVHRCRTRRYLGHARGLFWRADGRMCIPRTPTCQT